MRTCLLKNLRKDDLSILANDIKRNSRYLSVLKKLAGLTATLKKQGIVDKTIDNLI